MTASRTRSSVVMTLLRNIRLPTLACIMSPGSTSSTFVDRLILLAVPLMSMTTAETRSPSTRTSCTHEQPHKGQEGLQDHCKHLHHLEAPCFIQGGCSHPPNPE